MQISSRFTLAIHILTAISIFADDTKTTSAFLAGSTNVNAVTVRNILLQLKKAGIVGIQRGSGGAELARKENEITFLDIYKAVECVENDTLFHFHENPNTLCPVGRYIHSVLDEKLESVQRAMERELESITLEDVTKEIKDLI